MNEYRITKYNPKYRLNGVYQKNEWTSISDIGKSFDDGVLSLEDYLKVENSYIQFCLKAIEAAGISELSVSNPEIYCDGLSLPRYVRDTGYIHKIIEWCLREKCWLKLEAENFFIHFGYDFYLYIGTVVPEEFVARIAQDQNLYCECYHSPYRENGDDA